MNEDPPSPFDTIGDEPVEARIVAWVLGEASAFEAAELERLCEERPELLVFRRRMRALHGLLTEAEASEEDHSWKLPPEKRKLLDEICGEDQVVHLEPAREQVIRSSGRRAALAIAACLLLTIVALKLISPISLIGPIESNLSTEKAATFSSEAKALELAKAIRDQEDKVEERRKVLATIVRTKGIVYKGEDSFYGQSGVDEDKSGRSAFAANDTREDAIKRGLSNQDYADAKRDFETDQALLQTMKMKQIGESIASKMPDQNVIIHEVSASQRAEVASAVPASPAAPSEPVAMTMSLAKAKDGFSDAQQDKKRERLADTGKLELPAVETEAQLPELAESSSLQAIPQPAARGLSASGNAGALGGGFGGGIASYNLKTEADEGVSSGVEKSASNDRLSRSDTRFNNPNQGMAIEVDVKSLSSIGHRISKVRSESDTIISASAQANLSPSENAPAHGFAWHSYEKADWSTVQDPGRFASHGNSFHIGQEKFTQPEQIDHFVDHHGSEVQISDSQRLPDESVKAAMSFFDVRDSGWDLSYEEADESFPLLGRLFDSTPSDGDKTKEEVQKRMAAIRRQLEDPTCGKKQSLFKEWEELKKQIEAAQDEEPQAEIAEAQPMLADLIEEIPASENPYSTFSLNISDASFQLAKAALAKGERPDPASIKTEQFYNAVDYGDAAPAANEPVAATIEQSAHPVIPDRNLVRVALRTGSVGRSAVQPLRLTLLVDQSGSMVREDRRASMEYALAQLGVLLTKNDLVTVIGFSRTPHLLADGMTGDQAAKLADLVNQSASEGGTNLEEAMKLGGQLAQRHQLAGAQNRIVLFTDGAANLGDADPARLAEQVKIFRQSGFAFDIAGIGADGLNDKLLGELVRHGNGRYYVVGSEKTDSFAKQLAGAFRPAAENVKVQVNFNPQRVGKYKLIGFEKDRLKTEDFRNDAVDAAELAAEEAGVAIYQVETLPDGSGEIGEVSVRFRDAASKEMVERTWTMPYEPSVVAFDRATPSMQLAGLSLLAAEKLKGGPLADAIDFKLLSGVAAEVKQFYGASTRVGEMLQVIEKLK